MSPKLKRISLPALTGNIHVVGSGDEVVLMADPHGFRSLAALFESLADLDQSKAGLSPDEREHVHLGAGVHLGSKSARLVVSRLDDSRGKLADIYGRKQRAKRAIRESRYYSYDA